MSIRVKNIYKSYKGHVALRDMSFYIEDGEIVGFLGPNGAGKSTMMKILTTYIRNFEGKAEVNGYDVKNDVLNVEASIGYLPEQNPMYEEMYVREYLQFHANIHKVSKNRIKEVVDLVALAGEQNKKIEQLSKGYKQRVGLASALLHNPNVLILDEPTTGLDPNQLIEIRNLIKEIGKTKTVLFSTHILQEVEALCTRVLIINKGALIVDDTLEHLKNSLNQQLLVTFDKMIEKEQLLIIPNLTEANLVDKHKHTWQLVFNSKEDMSETVFDFGQEHQLKILQLQSEKQDLEKLFVELTQQV